MSESTTRQELLAKANEMPLDELAEMVIRGSYTPSIHDSVLLERIKAIVETDKQHEEELYL